MERKKEYTRGIRHLSISAEYAEKEVIQ